MVRVDAAVLGEFLSALGRCGPAGRRPPPPAVTARVAAGRRTLSAEIGGVWLTYRAPAPDEVDTVLAASAADLRAVAAAAAGPLELAPAGPGRLRATWAGGGGRDLPAAAPAAGPPAPPPAADWQPAGADFVLAMRDAARIAGRADNPRYAYHRVLVDAPAGKVVATDGVNLLAHGGFGWAAAAPAAVPAVGVWGAAAWARAGEPEVAFAADAVLVRAGPWDVSLPADPAARYPRYAELLARLRAPAARVTLSDADAAAWAAALAGWATSAAPDDDPVVLSLADPPALARGADPAARAAAPGSAFAGRRAVRARTAGRHLARALALGFRTLTAAGPGHPLVALDGPRRFAWPALDPPPRPPAGPPPTGR